MTWAAGSNSFSPGHRLVRADAKAVRPFKITAAKVRLAMAGKRSAGVPFFGSHRIPITAIQKLDDRSIR
jgi:hypothetical protein